MGWFVTTEKINSYIFFSIQLWKNGWALETLATVGGELKPEGAWRPRAGERGPLTGVWQPFSRSCVANLSKVGRNGNINRYLKTQKWYFRKPFILLQLNCIFIKHGLSGWMPLPNFTMVGEHWNLIKLWIDSTKTKAQLSTKAEQPLILLKIWNTSYICKSKQIIFPESTLIWPGKLG